MEKYELMFFHQDPQVMELTPEQVITIKEGLAGGHSVPLYITTFAKSKYGDCVIGNIIGINKIKNE